MGHKPERRATPTTTTPHMTVEQWPIDKVIPYARNPRKNDAAVDKVAASLREFGWRQPIVVDSEGIIIAGHTRYAAARRLGMETVPVHVATGLSRAQVKAYRLVDNRSAEFATWDVDLLAAELEDGVDLGSIAEFDFAGLLAELTPHDATLAGVHGADAQSGSRSPWDDVGDAADGVVFQFGNISRRFPVGVFEAFSRLAAIQDRPWYDEFARWLGADSSH